jgi:hypothetical protein
MVDALLSSGSTCIKVYASNDLPWIPDDNRSVGDISSNNRSRADDTVFAYSRARHEDREGSNEAVVAYRDTCDFLTIYSFPGRILLCYTPRLID